MKGFDEEDLRLLRALADDVRVGHSTLLAGCSDPLGEASESELIRRLLADEHPGLEAGA